MLLPSSMRINDPFSMKLEKVETPPAPAKLTPQQEFEQLNHDDPAHPTEPRLVFGSKDYYHELAEMWRFANSRFSKPISVSTPKARSPWQFFEDNLLRHVEAAKSGKPAFFGVDLSDPVESESDSVMRVSLDEDSVFGQVPTIQDEFPEVFKLALERQGFEACNQVVNPPVFFDPATPNPVKMVDRPVSVKRFRPFTRRASLWE